MITIIYINIKMYDTKEKALYHSRKRIYINIFENIIKDDRIFPKVTKYYNGYKYVREL